MQLDRFEAMVREMAGEIPAEYLDGVTEVTVSPRSVPHPVRDDIYTLGECIPLPLEGDAPEAIQSRVVLYHGSFRALAARDAGFDWRAEAWETLTHELRHHVEWRAHRDRLEAFDRAAEQNFARQDGDEFDPLFFLDREPVAPGVYQVEEDFFIDQHGGEVPAQVEFAWHGQGYRAAVPAGLTLPVYLVMSGVVDPPPGDLVVVVRRRPRLLDLFRKHRSATQIPVEAVVSDAAAPQTFQPPSAPG